MIQKAADRAAAQSRLDWRPSEAVRFAVAAGVGALVLVLIVVLVGLGIVGKAAAEAVDDVSPALLALVAALSCALAARRSVRRRRLAWSLIAASAFTWGLGATITGCTRSR